MLILGCKLGMVVELTLNKRSVRLTVADNGHDWTRLECRGVVARLGVGEALDVPGYGSVIYCHGGKCGTTRRGRAGADLAREQGEQVRASRRATT